MADIREQVSGIGANAKRTDLNVSNQPARYISGMPYGQGQATYEQQTAAPMAAQGKPRPIMPDVTPLTAPTTRPNEPITAGSDFGPGPGSEILPPMPSTPAVSLADTFKQLVSFDQSGDAELVYRELVDKGF